jgi:glycosyltransferase involved in cell wall biosynthesis
MKILMIAPEPFFEPRGTPISVYQRLQAISTLGHEVDLVVYPIGKDIEIQGVRIIRSPKIPFTKEIKIGPSLTKLFLDIFMFLKCIKLMQMKRYDLIHSHEEASFFSVILASFFQTFHIYDMHSSLPVQLENHKKKIWRPFGMLFRMLEKWVLKKCDAVFTIGGDLAVHVRKINPHVPLLMVENLPLQANGNNNKEGLIKKINHNLNINERLPVVYTGSFESYQGLDILFESVNILKKQIPHILFVLVGGSALQIERCKDKVKELQIENLVYFTGRVPPEEAIAYIEAAAVLVSPRIDGMSVPLKVYSYLYSGKPIVATNITAHTLVLNDEMAILVEPNKEALADGLRMVVTNLREYQQKALHNKKFINENYGFTDYLSKINTIYQSFESKDYHMNLTSPILKE